MYFLLAFFCALIFGLSVIPVFADFGRNEQKLNMRLFKERVF